MICDWTAWEKTLGWGVRADLSVHVKLRADRILPDGVTRTAIERTSTRCVSVIELLSNRSELSRDGTFDPGHRT